MKTFKRNAVIIAVLLFVAAAVYLNWSYGKTDDGAGYEAGTSAEPSGGAETLSAGDGEKAAGEAGVEAGAGLYYGGGPDGVKSGYFDEVRLERSQARDSAAAALVTVTETAGASQETIDGALEKITLMAERTVLEAELETLICSKGFSDCVVYISDGGVTVTVAPETVEGLSTAAVARITDVVTEKTGFTAKELNIVEIK